MKDVRILAIVAAFSAMVGTSVRAQFTTGSDGSYGPVEALSGTVTLAAPPDGIFHCTRVTIAQNARLKFLRNSLNTPIYLLSQGDIEVNGSIEVSGEDGTRTAGGEGGPGGYDGGPPGLAGRPAGCGFGPGAGRGGALDGTDLGHGSAAYGGLADTPSARDGAVYGGPLLVPLVGGSGGGGAPDLGGGGGGGALLLASDTRVNVSGVILARGGQNGVLTGGKASGGAIRIVAPVVTGGGALNVIGGAYGDTGGHGRIRIDTPARAGVTLTYHPQRALSIGSFMSIFPGPVPSLDIVQAAGQAIPEGATGSVQVVLPTGSPVTQTIRIQARNFTGCVPIYVVLTPESPEAQESDRVLIPAEIDMTTNPAAVDVLVTLPVNVVTFIDVWTRPEACPE